jgi:tripartite-type tricarboxylate transporter receptor subunit TctC
MVKMRLVVAFVALVAAIATAKAQDWPSRPVRFIVPFPGIAARLNAEINKAIAESAVRDGFLQSGQEPVGGSAEAFSRLVRGDFDTYARLVRELNIKAD